MTEEGRLLTCNCCGEVIQVFEFEFVRYSGFEPASFTDPETFWCVPCMDPRYWGIYPSSRKAVEARHAKRPSVDPQTMQIPF